LIEKELEIEKEKTMRQFSLLFLGLMALSVAFYAQEYQEGIPWGNAYFRPSVEFIYTHSDNIFLTDPSVGFKVDDNIWMLRPQLGLEFPFKNSYIKLEVQYEYKDYENYNLLHHDSWFAHMDSQFKFANDSILTISDHYTNGIQQTEQFDPDKEVYWNVTRFSRNDARAEYEIHLNPLNSMGMHIDYNVVNFKGDQDSGRMPFYSYAQKTGGLYWKYNYQPLASLILEWDHEKSNPKEDNYLYSPVGLYTTEKSYNEDRVSFGWEGNSERRLSGFAKMGFKKMKFNNNYNDFKGVVADAGLTFKLAEFSDLSTTLFKHATQSAFNVNNYYKSIGADLRFHHQFSRYLFGTVGGNYQVNDYPEGVNPDVNEDGIIDPFFAYKYMAGQHRNDEITRFLAEIGYHFSSKISLRLNYVYENRDSNIKYVDTYSILRKPYSYSENRFIFQIQMGW
jgi:hypothetical protein